MDKQSAKPAEVGIKLNFLRFARRYKSEDKNLHNSRREKLSFHTHAH
jgi:hypothetical protein